MSQNNSLITRTKKPIGSGSWSKREFYMDFLITKNNPAREDGITKLSDVLPELPYGIVYKDETGMGATTLELRSARNSIIVEPIKITASSKASKSHGYLYIGSPTRFHPTKITDDDILEYLQNTKIEFKKIIVVADSLGRVINAILMLKPLTEAIEVIKETTEKLKHLSLQNKTEALKNLNKLKDPRELKKNYNNTVLNDYFLLIDEIDSFQLDSSYRRSMEDCLDYYKMFQKEKRCMLSATDIKFSDSELQDEDITLIRYNIPSKRKINIITSTSRELQGKAYQRIADTLNKFSKNKILVAYNSVNGCYNLAENLVKHKIINKEEISILCSVQSKDTVIDYFKELDSDTLPLRLNFITSAYFTGFDLHEKFHLISISGNKNNSQALSEKRLKQIAGRCRNGLLTETIIHDTALEIIKEPLKKTKKDPTLNDLIDAATEQVQSLECMNKHYRKNRMLHDILEDINDRLMKLLDEKQMRFIRKDRDKNLRISYLNIDAKLESIRVRNELYLSYTALSEKLSKEHTVNIIERKTKVEIIESDFSYEYKDRSVRKIIESLKEVKNTSELNRYLKDTDLTSIQKTIVKDFKKLFIYFEPSSLLDKMSKSLLGKRDSRVYNSLLFSAQIQTLPDGHIVIDRLKHYFKAGKQHKYTTEHIVKRMKLFLLEIGNIKKVKDNREAVKMLRKFCSTYRKRDENDGLDYYHIRNYNPIGLPSIRKRKKLEENDLQTDISF